MAELRGVKFAVGALHVLAVSGTAAALILADHSIALATFSLQLSRQSTYKVHISLLWRLSEVTYASEGAWIMGRALYVSCGIPSMLVCSTFTAGAPTLPCRGLTAYHAAN